jgi:hypothetical protein
MATASRDVELPERRIESRVVAGEVELLAVPTDEEARRVLARRVELFAASTLLAYLRRMVPPKWLTRARLVARVLSPGQLLPVERAQPVV